MAVPAGRRLGHIGTAFGGHAFHVAARGKTGSQPPDGSSQAAATNSKKTTLRPQCDTLLDHVMAAGLLGQGTAVHPGQEGKTMAASGRDDLRAVVLRQVTALIQQFTDDKGNVAFIGIKGEQVLANRAQLLGGSVETLNGANRARALVYVDRNGEPELWCKPEAKVGPGSSNYKTDWNRFTNQYFGLSFKDAETEALNVDHLYPETTAKEEGLTHVRMSPANASSNQELGRTIEKLMAQRAGGRDRPIRKATELTLLKVCGGPASITLPDERGQPVEMRQIAQAIQHLNDLGMGGSNPAITKLRERLTQWSVTKIQGGNVDAIGMTQL